MGGCVGGGPRGRAVLQALRTIANQIRRGMLRFLPRNSLGVLIASADLTKTSLCSNADPSKCL